MNRAIAARAALALVVLCCSAYVLVTRPAKLGLDLRGGTQLVFQTRDAPNVQADADATDRALEVLRRRVDALGVAEPTLARSGDNRIIVELPGVQDPAEAAAVIGRTAQLTAHAVLGAGDPANLPAAGNSTPDTSKELTLADDNGTPLRLAPAAFAGDGISSAKAAYDPQLGGGWQVTIDFSGAGNRTWEKLTADAACQRPGNPQRRLAFVLDGAVISAPEVGTEYRCGVGITGSGPTRITGSFTEAEAKDLAVLIQGGALPVPVDMIEQRTVGATLGAEAIDASVRAAIIGAALTMLFLICVYRLVGLLAAVALGGYALISYAVLLALGATLTLPGIAGFVLAIGMAVDANVLVYERAREEYAARHRMRRSLTEGFRGALSAIADSNITTVLAAGLLFYLASGPVRGFGVTLTVGVLASLFAALVLTRALTDLTAGLLARKPGWSGLGDIGRIRRWLTERNPDLMRHGRRWIAVSVVVASVGAAGIAVRGLNLGLEFTGGRLVEYRTAQAVDAGAVRAAVADAGLDGAVVQASGDREVTIRSAGFDDAAKGRVAGVLDRLGGDAEQVRDEFVGPSLGDELRRKALIALGVALLAQLAYLAIRFRPAFGLGAVLAMVHDVLVLVGVFAWLGKPIDGVFLAAVLTIIGYSVNDSVVIFDRVRELLRGRRRGTSVVDVANTACLQTVPRTVNTGAGAILILAALFLLGGDTLRDFALALLLGVVVGTWSSVFTATPIAVEFLKRRPTEPAKRSPSSRAPRPGARPQSGARV